MTTRLFRIGHQVSVPNLPRTGISYPLPVSAGGLKWKSSGNTQSFCRNDPGSKAERPGLEALAAILRYSGCNLKGESNPRRDRAALADKEAGGAWLAGTPVALPL